MSYPWCDFAAKGTFPTASYELSWMCPAMTEEGWPHDTFLSWDEIFRAGALCGFWAGLPLSHLGSRYKKRDLKQHCQQHESLTLVKWIEALGCWWCKWPFKHKPYPCYGLKQKILRLMVVNLTSELLRFLADSLESTAAAGTWSRGKWEEAFENACFNVYFGTQSEYLLTFHRKVDDPITVQIHFWM